MRDSGNVDLQEIVKTNIYIEEHGGKQVDLNYGGEEGNTTITSWHCIASPKYAMFPSQNDMTDTDWRAHVTTTATMGTIAAQFSYYGYQHYRKPDKTLIDSN